MIHVVTQGETLWSISQRYRIPAKKIASDNQLIHPDHLVVGQALLLLHAKENMDFCDTVKTGIVSGGYGYPFADKQVLREALPYLSEFYMFSYGFTADGDLLPIDDEEWIVLSREYGTKPILVLTPSGETGSFYHMPVTEVIRNPARRTKLISQLLTTVQKKGYGGLDLDFAYISKEDRFWYAEFVQEAREAMNAGGYTVSVTLPPRISPDRRGDLYEGMDYRLLGEAADSVLLMTYEWDDTYREPMSVAPIPSVRRVLDYAVTEIPAGKISLGIPNCGYDWPLPYRKGFTRARSIGNVEAIRIAQQYNALIRYDEAVQSPHFQYVTESTLREVWFEDVRSLQERFDLVRGYGLRGVGYWNLMGSFRAGWLLLDQNFSMIKT